jgi:hypothetical protein
VRSSIFSFDRAPARHAIVGVAVAAVVGVLAFASVEVYWRHVGARPTHVDGPARWAQVRESVESSDHPRRTVIMGASRILFAFSLDTFAERYRDVPIAQLAVPAKGPLATLEDFAYETDFSGVVLFDFDPENLLPPREADQADFVDFYRSRWSWDQQLNFRIANLLEPVLISRQYAYGVNQLVRDFLRSGTLPNGPLYLRIRADRVHQADFELTDAMELQNNRFGAMARRYDELERVVDDLWDDTLRRLGAAISAIHRRSGCVVFIRMPIVGRSLEQDQRVFKGAKYWDDVLDELNVHGVHYGQIAGVSEFPLPDAQHIDARDQPRFTNALLDELDELGIYDQGGSCRP